jgi:hypothetical protein
MFHMASMLHTTPGPKFVGRKSVFQFVNSDGTNPATACGQAALATVLAARRRIPMTIAGLRTVEDKYPADIVSGVWGTSRARVLSALNGFKLGHRYAKGRQGLHDDLVKGKYAIALIQNTAGLGGIGDGAHWFVVFGCDANGVHVTNYGTPVIPWSDFEGMWSAPMPVAVGMGEQVITC